MLMIMANEDGSKNDEKTVSSLNWPQPFPQLGLQHFTPPSKIGQQYKTHVIDRDDEQLFCVPKNKQPYGNIFSILIFIVGISIESKYPHRSLFGTLLMASVCKVS